MATATVLDVAVDNLDAGREPESFDREGGTAASAERAGATRPGPTG